MAVKMSALKEEIKNLKETLRQLEMERQNLLDHFKIQEDNYAAIFKKYTEKVELLIKQQEDQIEELLKEKCVLEAVVRGDNLEESPVLQYRF